MKKAFLLSMLSIILIFALWNINSANQFQILAKNEDKIKNIETDNPIIPEDDKINDENELQPKISEIQEDKQGEVQKEKQIEPAKKTMNKNILILGVDSRKNEPARADTIMLLNMREDKINLISIPRDSRVLIKGKGKARINASYAFGGIELCKTTVEKLLNTKIHNYVVFNFRAVQKGVNSLGGFTVTIPKDIRISDPELKKRFLLEEGIHTLNGVQTLEYLRYRKDGKGDIGRIYRQQQFIKDLQQSFLKLENIPLIPRAYVAIHDEIKTDMKASDMTSYFLHGYKLRDKFEYHTMKGYNEVINKACYYMLYESSIKEMANILK